MTRDRCYTITDGKGRILSVRAAKKPSARTQAALLNLFEAARKHLLTCLPDADACDRQRFPAVKRTELPKSK
jgi:hypothetical protein